MVREHVRVTDETPVPAILASDAEREQTAEVLRQASVDGRLTLDEFSQRVELALAARTRADLRAITADLPAAVPGAPPVRAVPARRTRTPVRWSVALLGSVNRK